MSNKALNIELMSLKFFSSRFLIWKPCLEYGIVLKTVKETEETAVLPAILIKDTRLFINICEDRLCPLVSDSYYGYKALPCEFLQDETDYIFHTSEHEVDITNVRRQVFTAQNVFRRFREK